jgi:hypothetical protein
MTRLPAATFLGEYFTRPTGRVGTATTSLCIAYNLPTAVLHSLLAVATGGAVHGCLSLPRGRSTFLSLWIEGFLCTPFLANTILVCDPAPATFLYLEGGLLSFSFLCA